MTPTMLAILVAMEIALAVALVLLTRDRVRRATARADDAESVALALAGDVSVALTALREDVARLERTSREDQADHARTLRQTGALVDSILGRQLDLGEALVAAREPVDALARTQVAQAETLRALEARLDRQEAAQDERTRRIESQTAERWRAFEARLVEAMDTLASARDEDAWRWDESRRVLVDNLSRLAFGILSGNVSAEAAGLDPGLLSALHVAASQLDPSLDPELDAFLATLLSGGVTFYSPGADEPIPTSDEERFSTRAELSPEFFHAAPPEHQRALRIAAAALGFGASLGRPPRADGAREAPRRALAG